MTSALQPVEMGRRAPGSRCPRKRTRCRSGYQTLRHHPPAQQRTLEG